MAGEQIVFCFAYLPRVLASRITCLKPLLADRVRDIEQMQFVGGTGLIDQRAHPMANADCIGLEIQGNGKALP